MIEVGIIERRGYVVHEQARSILRMYRGVTLRSPANGQKVAHIGVRNRWLCLVFGAGREFERIPHAKPVLRVLLQVDPTVDVPCWIASFVDKGHIFVCRDGRLVTTDPDWESFRVFPCFEDLLRSYRVPGVQHVPLWVDDELPDEVEVARTQCIESTTPSDR
jgi:hypothetical protein